MSEQANPGTPTAPWTATWDERIRAAQACLEALGPFEGTYHRKAKDALKAAGIPALLAELETTREVLRALLALVEFRYVKPDDEEFVKACALVDSWGERTSEPA